MGMECRKIKQKRYTHRLIATTTMLNVSLEVVAHVIIVAFLSTRWALRLAFAIVTLFALPTGLVATATMLVVCLEVVAHVVIVAFLSTLWEFRLAFAIVTLFALP